MSGRPATRTTGLALGWATIDTERAAAAWPPGGELADDPTLGARARLVATATGIVLLEPATEGRLAAALARSGEGPAVIYVRTSRSPSALRAAGVALSVVAPGPLGPQALVLGGSRFGPNIMVVFEAAALDTIDA